MSDFDSGTSTRRLRRILFAVLFIVLFVGAAFLWPRFEGEAPHVRLSSDMDVLGTAPLEIVVSDGGTGLRSVTVTLSSGSDTHRLADETFAQPVPEQRIAVQTAKITGLKEGPAVLRVTARDRSWRGWFGGNETVLQKNLTIDVTPPTLGLIADDRYITFGGVGAIVYSVSEETVKTGVRIGDHFFPGQPRQDRPNRYFVLFAHPYNVPANSRAVLVATDRAGNTRELPLGYTLRNVRYRKSTIPVSDRFIQNKVAPLVTDVSARQGSAKDIFLRVNRDLRKENDARIAEITSRITPTVLWKGAFRQLSNSKVEANFADARTYTYNKEAIDQAYHLGYDLSVTRQYPVEAANSGKVVFTGDLGIYGNTVILDHGLGLFTLYSHLSSIGVKVGDSIQQRQILGRTGETGLAAGDHLHFGVYLNGVAVLPVEWWDGKWVAENIQPKLDGLGGAAIARLQDLPAASPKPAPAPQKP